MEGIKNLGVTWQLSFKKVLIMHGCEMPTDLNKEIPNFAIILNHNMHGEYNLEVIGFGY